MKYPCGVGDDINDFLCPVCRNFLFNCTCKKEEDKDEES